MSNRSSLKFWTQSGRDHSLSLGYRHVLLTKLPLLYQQSRFCGDVLDNYRLEGSGLPKTLCLYFRTNRNSWSKLKSSSRVQPRRTSGKNCQGSQMIYSGTGCKQHKDLQAESIKRLNRSLLSISVRRKPINGTCFQFLCRLEQLNLLFKII